MSIWTSFRKRRAIDQEMLATLFAARYDSIETRYVAQRMDPDQISRLCRGERHLPLFLEVGSMGNGGHACCPWSLLFRDFEAASRTLASAEVTHAHAEGQQAQSQSPLHGLVPLQSGAGLLFDTVLRHTRIRRRALD